jgi:YVTN family beta-propeller protein
VNPATRTLIAALLFEGQVALIDVTVPENPHVNPTPIALGPDTFPVAVAVDTANNRAVVVNQGDSTLTVIDLGTRTVARTIDLGPFIDEDNGDALAFVALYRLPSMPTRTLAAVVNQPSDGLTLGSLLLVDATTGSILDIITVGNTPSAVAINTATNTALVANQEDDTISVINLTSRSVTTTLPVGDQPAGIAVDPTTNVALVTSFGDNRVTAVHMASPYDDTVLQLGVGGTTTPLDIAWQPDPVRGVVLMSPLVPVSEDVGNVIVMGLPTAVLP